MAQYGAVQILFHQDDFDRLYVNACQTYNVDDVPLAFRQHPILGGLYIVLFLIYEVKLISLRPIFNMRTEII